MKTLETEFKPNENYPLWPSWLMSPIWREDHGHLYSCTHMGKRYILDVRTDESPILIEQTLHQGHTLEVKDLSEDDVAYIIEKLPGWLLDRKLKVTKELTMTNEITPRIDWDKSIPEWPTTSVRRESRGARMIHLTKYKGIVYEILPADRYLLGRVICRGISGAANELIAQGQEKMIKRALADLPRWLAENYSLAPAYKPESEPENLWLLSQMMFDNASSTPFTVFASHEEGKEFLKGLGLPAKDELGRFSLLPITQGAPESLAWVVYFDLAPLREGRAEPQITHVTLVTGAIAKPRQLKERWIYECRAKSYPEATVQATEAMRRTVFEFDGRKRRGDGAFA